MDREPTERALVDRARRGDAEAFAAIVRSRMDAVFRLALAIVAQEADAADVSQEAFVSAWRRLPGLRDPDRFDAWLDRITVNAARMALRARGRRRVRELPADVVESLASGSLVPQRSDAAVLRSALERLPADQRAILALHHLDGSPLAAIAESLGIPVGTAKSRLFHARSALQRALREEESRR